MDQEKRIVELEKQVDELTMALHETIVQLADTMKLMSTITKMQTCHAKAIDALMNSEISRNKLLEEILEV